MRMVIKSPVVEKEFIPGWKRGLCFFEVALNSPIVCKLSSIIKSWVTEFSFCTEDREDNFAQNHWNVPTIINRVDFTIVDGEPKIYEIEDRPAGIGVCCIANSCFHSNLVNLRAKWPKFYVVTSPKRKADDFLWVETRTLAETVEDTSPVFPRVCPHEQEYHSLMGRCLSTLRAEGCKQYGVGMGLWHKVSQFTDLPYGKDFILKSLQGFGGNGMIFVPKFSSENHPEILGARKEALETLKQQGQMYLQELSPPMKWEINGDEYNVIFRFYFGYHPRLGEYIPLGGLWNGRPATAKDSWKINNAEDAIFGPLALR